MPSVIYTRSNHSNRFLGAVQVERVYIKMKEIVTFSLTSV